VSPAAQEVFRKRKTKVRAGISTYDGDIIGHDRL